MNDIAYRETTDMQIIRYILAALGFQPRQRFAVLRDVTPRLLR